MTCILKTKLEKLICSPKGKKTNYTDFIRQFTLLTPTFLDYIEAHRLLTILMSIAYLTQWIAHPKIARNSHVSLNRNTTNWRIDFQRSKWQCSCKTGHSHQHKNKWFNFLVVANSSRDGILGQQKGDGRNLLDWISSKFPDPLYTYRFYTAIWPPAMFFWPITESSRYPISVCREKWRIIFTRKRKG